MKKLILFISMLSVAISFNSCSDDDDEEVIVVDKIIGKWQFEQLFEDDVELPLTDCEKTSTLEFFTNGTFIEKDFMEDENGDCMAFDPISGTWKNLGNSMYRFGDWEISPGFSVNIDVKVTFTDNKMTMVYTYTDEDDIIHEIKGIYRRI